MKKKGLIISVISAAVVLCIALTLIFVLPKINGGNNTNDTADVPDKMNSSVSGSTSTLMIYMIGSDLEAKGGLATKDLEEITQSGVSLDKNNVLVYAGGSKAWHNDVVSKGEHSLLELKAGGFEKIKRFEDSSMGNADNLSAFLKYSVENYPADKYSLILWNHGNGPLIGYGSDMLYDDDALTLAEMSEALSASPFSKDKKLSFVGFDACLMSSAELCCVWADYADYLIASQEIEPSFGWNYAFIKDINEKKTTVLAEDILNGYLEACEAYYEKKGYDDRDTTLACIDLSKTEELRTAINNLFDAANNDILTNYNTFAVKRVNTRALGRASTGSEYDLVDLYDFAVQMSENYQSESEALKKAIEELVVYNVTNTENLCGVSIYYPFYNKSYYEKSWGSIYKKLNVFPSYTEYIDAYATRWLSDDILKANASSIVPNQSNNTKFTLTLTEEQSKTYASAKYYILEREGEELYTCIYSSSDVKKDQNKLTAYFDGNVLYGKSKYDYVLPVTTQHDTVGDITRYSAYVVLTNQLTSALDRPEGYELNSEGYRFHIAANNKTKEISTSALIPFDTEVDFDKLISGKAEDADLSLWSQYRFMQERHRYITRYDNGTIKPLSEWQGSSYYSSYVTRVGDGMEFVFAPLEKGEYCLIFEIEDVQGNKYCSDLVPFTADGVFEPIGVSQDNIEIVCEEGDSRIKLLDKENIELYLKVSDSYNGQRFSIEAVNNNDYDIFISGDNLFYNDEVYCPDGNVCFFKVGANSTAVNDSTMNFGDAEDLGLLKDAKSIQFSVNVYTYKNDRTIIKDQWFSVELASSHKDMLTSDNNVYADVYDDIDNEVRSLMATTQTLWEKDGMKVELVSLGGDGRENSSLIGHFRFVNTTNEIKYIQPDNFVLNGVCLDLFTGAVVVPQRSVVNEILFVSADDMDFNMITSVNNASFRFRMMDRLTLDGGGGSYDPVLCKIKLKKNGNASVFKEGEEVLYDKNGVRIALIKSEAPEDNYSSYYWYLSLVNTSGRDLSFACSEDGKTTINGEVASSWDFSGFGIHQSRCGNNEKTVLKAFCNKSKGDSVEIKLYLDFFDYKNEMKLWETTEPITLKAEIN